jgi:arylsulfatase
VLACAEPAPKPRDVLLITVDTLRADHLGAYASSLALTPNLDALAQESLVFESAYAPAPLTLPSIASLMTGRLPEALGVTTNGSNLDVRAPTLATTLQARGYRTGAVIGSYVLRREVGLARGFDVYDDEYGAEELVRHKPERVGDETTRAAIRMLERLGEDWAGGTFLWVHYQDPHGPYTPPAGYRERFIEAERRRPDGARELARGEAEGGFGEIPHYQFAGHHEVAWYRAGYAGEVHFLDEQIGRLLAEIEAHSLLDDPVIVFTADHGESLGELDYWFAHGEYLHDFQVRVPLLVRIPGVAPGRRSDVASLLDVLPTLRSAIDFAPAADAAGRDLLVETAEPPPIYLSTLQQSSQPGAGLVWRGHKYLRVDQGGKISEQLFALGDEGVNLAERAPVRLQGFRERLDAIRAAVARDPAAAAHPVLTADERQNLLALGYVE